MTPKTKRAERDARIASAIKGIDKKHGAGVVVRFDRKALADAKIEGFSWGSLGLDVISGCMGAPRGRITELFGAPSGGKSTLALHAVASAQRAGCVAAYIDAEHAFDPNYARKLGVDVGRLLVSQPDYGEQALEVASVFIETKCVDLIVIDSVAALTPRAELEGDIGDQFVGTRARMVTSALYKQAPLLRKTDIAMIYLNQIRAVIGGMQWGPKTDTAGGYGLKHYASLRIEVTRVGKLKSGDRVIGADTRCRVVKNKVGGFPYAECKFDLMYGEGVSQEGEILDAGVKYGVVDKSGASYSFHGEQIGYGRENGKYALRGNPELAARIRVEIVPIYEKSVSESVVHGDADKSEGKGEANGGKEEEVEE